jgi:uncharacterized membrane protein YeaQ/YmgE (transglycosylase-associated protein family)
MAIIHCLWIGALAGVLASRGVRSGVASAPLVSTIAVAIFGALLGGLVQSWNAISMASLPLATLVVPALGAVLALFAWALAHRTVLGPRANSRSKDRA